MHKNKRQALAFIALLIHYLQSGFSLNQALEILSKDFYLAKAMHDAQLTGKTQWDVLACFNLPKTLIHSCYMLDPFYPLDETLNASYQLYLKLAAITKQCLSKLFYPIALLVLSTAMIYFIQQMIIPQLYLLEQQLTHGHSISLTHIFDRLLQGMMISWLLLGLLLIATYYFYQRNPSLCFDLLLKIPFIHTLFQSYHTFLFSYYYQSYLQQGMSESTIIQQMTIYLINPIQKAYINKIHQRLLSGAPLELAFDQPLFLPSFKHVLYHSFKITDASLLLKNYHQQLIQQIEVKTKQLTVIITGLIFILIALSILFLYLLLFLPLFQSIDL